MVIAVLSPAVRGIPRFILENHSAPGNSLGTFPEFFFASFGPKKWAEMGGKADERFILFP
jgi:hypothetical protein